uniref:Uncharacterized protein n=1 Tax=Ditylenchus dipsaci TaxID=166011 RepID=A0A915CR57_9BILA
MMISTRETTRVATMSSCFAHPTFHYNFCIIFNPIIQLPLYLIASSSSQPTITLDNRKMYSTELATSPMSYPEHVRNVVAKNKKLERARREAGFGKTFLEQIIHEKQPTQMKPVPPKIQKRRNEKREWAPMKASEHSQNTINPSAKFVTLCLCHRTH